MWHSSIDIFIGISYYVIIQKLQDISSECALSSSALVNADNQKQELRGNLCKFVYSKIQTNVLVTLCSAT